jgi:hypothetical protein
VRRNRGQLAIGLAFAFTAILAMFGLVFNSAMMTREKLKLQQTTDFAALRAANVQRYNLNAIRDYNQAIEILYDIYIARSQLQWCMIELLPAASNQEQTVIAASDSITHKTSTNCESACLNYESWKRDQLISEYNTLRGIIVVEIQAILDGANSVAHDKVVETFMTGKNLPHGLMRMLVDILGANFTTAAARAVYDSGQLANIFSISDMKDAPLFNGIPEIRLFPAVTWHYPTIITGTGVNLCGPPAPGLPDLTKTSFAKIIQGGNYTTSFLASASYTPRNTVVDEKFAIYLKEPSPDRRELSPYLTDEHGQKANLFHINDKTNGFLKYPMVTMALAKPYGGTFPRMAPGITLPPPFPFNFLTYLGDEFTGAKLIGLADRDQLKGFKILPDVAFGADTLYQEDFLH